MIQAGLKPRAESIFNNGFGAKLRLLRLLGSDPVYISCLMSSNLQRTDLPRYVRGNPAGARAGSGYWWSGAVRVAGACRSARADRAVSQAKPVTMLARWNSPPRSTRRGDWLKPAVASAMAAG